MHILFCFNIIIALARIEDLDPLNGDYQAISETVCTLYSQPFSKTCVSLTFANLHSAKCLKYNDTNLLNGPIRLTNFLTANFAHKFTSIINHTML